MSAEETTAPVNAPAPRQNIVQETLTELKKTTWPTRAEATRLTLIVVGVLIVLSLYMGALDAILTWLVNRFSLIR